MTHFTNHILLMDNRQNLLIVLLRVILFLWMRALELFILPLHMARWTLKLVR